MRRVTINLTDKAYQILINHKIQMQKKSIKKNVNFTNAVNDFVEKKK